MSPRGDAVPAEARDALRDHPDAVELVAPERGKPCQYASMLDGCGRPATWSVRAVRCCLYHAWQAIRWDR